MYDDSWYSFVDHSNPNRSTPSAQGPGHRRSQSLLQQPNGTITTPGEAAQKLENVYEDIENTNTPPEPTLTRRAASYSDFYHVVKAQLSKDVSLKKKKAPKKNRRWESLALCENSVARLHQNQGLDLYQPALEEKLLQASQEDYLLYRDQLVLTERHLTGLVDDANSTLDILATLSNSFNSVEMQTSSFRSQCEDLLTEQRRLEKLADDVGTDLHYYAYLETATRRLNAPGASRLVEDDDFGDMVSNIDACVVFMGEHEKYRDRDTYLARYQALLTKALHLLDHGFTARLDKVMSEIGRQIAATQSDAARHALAYGRFEEMITDTYSLVPNIQKVIRRAFDQWGRPVVSSRDLSTYSVAAGNMFQVYLTTRDRHLKTMVQHDVDEYKKEVKSLSVETASRNHIKQCFEQLYNEDNLFTRVFSVEPTWSSAPESAFQIVKAVNTTMVHPGHLAPLGTLLEQNLKVSDLKTVCNIVGWLANEYSVAEVEEEESPFFRRNKEYAAQLLVWHLWPLTDGAFEAEINRSITRTTIQDNTLTIGPVEGGASSSNAHALVKKAIELLSMFDQAMPKERSSKDSPVVFKIVRETIQILQKAEARIRSIRNGTDPDLFMIKNLLIIKNELLALEIGDIRGHAASMQHFGQIWDTLSPSNWVSFFGSVIGGSLWSRGGGAPTVTAKTLTLEDMSEQLDELLRQSIHAFANRWATLTNDAKARKTGVKPIAKVESELETILTTAFSNQPEVIEKLEEAIELSAQAQNDAKDGKKGARRY
ncbi:Conserved oligomeric Golgi complex subunit-like protein [Emericellopsis cladophorae]|uniref:Conserved oligomeric Golgi complex subunit 3 n=1 Tax=Emericellopsis cladophorae TaxID=2686198 RepID=A0A9P9XZ38_9HYPO|nr:Conserved oligomeric Golgi complex subunit-like protein [Emericellopsis cladophorae]KAI6779984.1 Conserved oligomeric Golgi complex subunit-like protein [Emericellopsis cladophorae]